MRHENNKKKRCIFSIENGYFVVNARKRKNSSLLSQKSYLFFSRAFNSQLTGAMCFKDLCRQAWKNKMEEGFTRRLSQLVVSTFRK